MEIFKNSISALLPWLNAASSYLSYFPIVLRWRHFLPETWLIFIRPTPCYIPEDKCFHTHRCENLKPYKVNKLVATRKMDFEILLTLRRIMLKLSYDTKAQFFHSVTK
jgi:hypothetical protein